MNVAQPWAVKPIYLEGVILSYMNWMATRIYSCIQIYQIIRRKTCLLCIRPECLSNLTAKIWLKHFIENVKPAHKPSDLNICFWYCGLRDGYWFYAGHISPDIRIFREYCPAMGSKTYLFGRSNPQLYDLNGCQNIFMHSNISNYPTSNLFVMYQTGM